MSTHHRKRLLVAVNPSASFGRHRPVGPVVVDALTAAGHDVVALERPSQEELRDAVREALGPADERAGRPDALVVVGGDGMVSLGAGLVASTGIPLALVPTGTGNDFARALGLPFDDPARAISQLVALLDEPPRPVDALLARGAHGETWVAGGVSAGFDAFVNERANRMRRPRGRARYDIALALELVRLRQVDYEVVVDGGRSQVVAGTLVSVGNARSVGGGITLLPDAVVDDGLLDLLIVDRLSRRAFLRLFPRVSKGTHGDDPRVRMSRATTVRIDAPRVVAYGDGERLGPLPLEIEVVPGALLVYAPLSTS